MASARFRFSHQPPKTVLLSAGELLEIVPDAWKKEGFDGLTNDVRVPCEDLFTGPTPGIRLSRIATLIPDAVRPPEKDSDDAFLKLSAGRLTRRYQMLLVRERIEVEDDVEPEPAVAPHADPPLDLSLPAYPLHPTPPAASIPDDAVTSVSAPTEEEPDPSDKASAGPSLQAANRFLGRFTRFVKTQGTALAKKLDRPPAPPEPPSAPGVPTEAALPAEAESKDDPLLPPPAPPSVSEVEPPPPPPPAETTPVVGKPRPGDPIGDAIPSASRFVKSVTSPIPFASWGRPKETPVLSRLAPPPAPVPELPPRPPIEPPSPAESLTSNPLPPEDPLPPRVPPLPAVTAETFVRPKPIIPPPPAAEPKSEPEPETRPEPTGKPVAPPLPPPVPKLAELPSPETVESDEPPAESVAEKAEPVEIDVEVATAKPASLDQPVAATDPVRSSIPEIQPEPPKPLALEPTPPPQPSLILEEMQGVDDETLSALRTRASEEIPDQETVQALFLTEDDLTIDDVVERCSGLPGIRCCILARGRGVISSANVPDGIDVLALSAHAVQMAESMQSALAKMGLGEVPAVTLHSERGLISLLPEGDLCLLAIHADRAFVPGVREKLVAAVRALHSANLPLSITDR